jgi:hypothetical protein
MRYWLKVAFCCTFLVLFAVSELSGDWYGSLDWPWNGLLQLGSVFVTVSSPLVFIYLVVLATRQK